jgi:hypothetical protein
MDSRCVPSLKPHVIVSPSLRSRVNSANDLTDCAVHHHRSSPQHSAPWSSATSGEIPLSGQDDMGEAAMRGGVKRRCVPSMNSHVIVREANDLTDCAVQRHGASPQHGVSWTHAASLHENHVIVSPSLRSRVNSANDLTDCAVQRHRSSLQPCVPWPPMPCSEIPPSGQDDMGFMEVR